MSRRKMTFNTIKIPVEYTSTGDKDMIISYQRQQTHIVRSVYKKEEKKQDYDFNSFNNYNDIDLLDSWWKQSAVYEGKAKYDSKLEIEEQEEKAQKLSKADEEAIKHLLNESKNSENNQLKDEK